MISRIPTTVAAFDSIIKGGIPVGSVVILYGEPGAGAHEFAMTSISKLQMAREHPERLERLVGGSTESIYLPERSVYITLTRSEAMILREAELTFREDLYGYFKRNLKVYDLSEDYFSRSIVPASWTGNVPLLLRGSGEEREMLTRIVEIIEEEADGSVIVLDSLTDLLLNPRVENTAIVDLLRGLRRKAKEWNTIIYMLLTKNVAPPDMEATLFDSVDGVLVFEWYGSPRTSKRRRYLYVLKFAGLMAFIDESMVARFDTRLNRESGLVVIHMEKIG